MRLRFWTPERLSEAKEARLGVASDAAVARLLTTRWGIPISRSSVQNAMRAARGAEGEKKEPLLTPPASQGSWDGVERRKSSPAERWLYRNVSPESMNASAAPQPAAEPPSETPAPAPWVKKTYDHYLVVSDLQMPYHHPGALEFCQRVRREYSVPLENVLCVGDEFDFYWLSRFDHSPDAEHSPLTELAAAKLEAARWKVAFPHLRICDSNHVHGRIKGAASRGGLASPWIRTVREVFDLPETWRWAPFWIVPAKHPFRVEHGHMRPGGHSGLRNRPTNRGISTAWGHEHAEPAAIHVDTAGGQQVWGMRVGSLLTREPVAALSYNAEDASRPVGSVGVVLDDGRTPLVVRM